MRIRECQTREELEDTVDELITIGYEIKERGELSVRMKETKGDEKYIWHAIWFLLLPILGNLLYYLYYDSQKEEVLIRVETSGTER